MGQQPYQRKEFPRVVYGPEGDEKIIQTEEERPEGYDNFPLDHPLHGEQTEAKKPSKTDQKKADIEAYLDEHSVKYEEGLSLPKLEDLKSKLDEYLAEQENRNDSQQ